MKRLLFLLLMLLTAVITFAQEKSGDAIQRTGSGNIYENILLTAVLITILLALIASLVLLQTVKIISKKLIGPAPYIGPVQLTEFEEKAGIKTPKAGIWSRILELRPIAEEKDMMMEHEFDGIKELDNPTPGWFMWLFYATIVFAVVYLAYFHVFNIGKMQEEEYAIEMKVAKTDRDKFLAKSPSNIDENSVKQTTDAGVISAGEAIFKTNCVACHGDKAQGVVGPNLTDEYSLHGGKINNLFKTIKYGVPEKGMISWEKTLSPKQISDVTNFILSLKGTNPLNPKAAEGNKES